jgi:aminoglycoside phosphotransferase (APT) family kinase protein
VLRALADTEVPVARALGLCEDDAVIGTAFYLMEYVGGRVFWLPQLTELERPERARIHDEANRVIAALHTVDPLAVGLGDYGKTGAYIARQVARWASSTRPRRPAIPAMDRLMEWLPENAAGRDTDRAWRLYRQA